MDNEISNVIKELEWLDYQVKQIEESLWNLQSEDGILPIGKSATSEQVINFYNILDNLENKLGDLAMNWRREESEEESKNIVHAYHETMQYLWNLGWRGSILLPDSELPDELMPQYFISYWKERHK